MMRCADRLTKLQLLTYLVTSHSSFGSPAS